MQIISNHTKPAHREIIKGLIDKSDQIIFCVAFLKLSGLNHLIRQLNLKVGKCSFYIGTDFYLTEPNALRLLCKQGHPVYITQKDNSTYHPKIFYFKSEDSITMLAGSANLTSGGLDSNFEVSILIETNSNSSVDKEFQQLIEAFKNHSKQVTEHLINKYEKNFLSYRQHHSEADKELERLLVAEDKNENKKNKISTKPTESTPKLIQVSQKDFDEFPHFFKKYKAYLKIRPGGVVNKNTEDRELFYWYLRMKSLIFHQVLPEEFAKQLNEVDFPFGDGWEVTRIMIWDKRFAELVAYKNKHNLRVTHVPQHKSRNHPDYKLGSWCAQQKQRWKGNQPPIWTDYEEQKMQSVKFLFEVPNLGGGQVDDDNWMDWLLQLEKYYSNKTNYKTVPPQTTKLGRWVNEQMTLKNTGSRQKKQKYFLNPTREEMLGAVLKENGVEWKWQDQKERESIIEGLEKWTAMTKAIGNRKPTREEREKYFEIFDWRNQIRFKSKKKNWEQWKRDLLIKAGFPLPNVDKD